MKQNLTNSYTQFMNNLSKQQSCLVIGGCELSFSYGYDKSSNIKFVNLSDVQINDKSVDFGVDIGNSTPEQLNKAFVTKFDTIVLECLPFDVTPYVLINLQHILINNGTIVLKGFGISDICERLESCQMFGKINTLKNFLIINQINNYKIINFFGLSKGFIYK